MLKKKKASDYLRKNYWLYIMLIPCVSYFIVFHYMPLYGILIAFKDFSFSAGILGSEWVGFDHFIYLFSNPDFFRVLGNSLILSIYRLVFAFPIPIILAIMLNEIKWLKYKKLCQTFLYLPYFISWVVIGGILTNLLSPSWGIINIIITRLGGEAIFFLGDDSYFRIITVVSHIWKQAGWDTIIYLAAITSISPEYYEAAKIDGASKLQQIRYITLPSLKGTIVILLLLSIGNIMNNGFEQISILQNNNNLVVSEVFETYAYRLGLVNGRFSFATTVGLFSSAVGFVLLIISNKIAKKTNNEGLF